MGKGAPQSIRIRTNDDNRYRYDAIEQAAEFSGRGIEFTVDETVSVEQG